MLALIYARPPCGALDPQPASRAQGGGRGDDCWVQPASACRRRRPGRPENRAGGEYKSNLAAENNNRHSVEGCYSTVQITPMCRFIDGAEGGGRAGPQGGSPAPDHSRSIAAGVLRRVCSHHSVLHPPRHEPPPDGGLGHCNGSCRHIVHDRRGVLSAFCRSFIVLRAQTRGSKV